MVATVIFLTTTGAGTWTVPADWNDAVNSIEVIGGGAGGFTAIGGQVTTGGGGGAYSKVSNVTLTPGASVPYSVGVGRGQVVQGPGGDTWFGDASYASATVGAKGGSPGIFGPGGPALGGQASAGIGTVKYSGGNAGSVGSIGGSSGGGGGAGPNGPGGNSGNTSSDGASGGGGGGGGSNSANTSSNGGTAGGNNYLGVGGGAAGIISPPTAPMSGTAGGGGGGGSFVNDNSQTTTNGGHGTEWDATHGSGGGAGGLVGNTSVGASATAGRYGAGGAGNASGNAFGRNGAQGIIVIKYTSAGADQDITAALFSNSNTFLAAAVALSISGALYANANTFFGATIAVPTPPPVDHIDMHDGNPSVDHLAERNRVKKEAQDKLRQAVRKAARRVNGEVDDDPLPEEPEALALAIQADLKADGIAAAVGEIEAMLAEVQHEMALRNQAIEDDMLATLLLTGEI